MKLVAFGDSFVEGLIKEPYENSRENRKEINFVSQLINLDNCFTEAENYGVRGSSNERIAYEAYKRLKHSYSYCFFLVAWSGIERQEIYNIEKDKYEYQKVKRWPEKNLKFQSEMFMISLHQIFKYYKIPHAFVNAFQPLQNSNKIFDTEFFKSINYVNPDFLRNTLFDIISNRYGKNIPIPAEEQYINHDYFKVEKSKYIADCLHPSKEGHRLIAKTLNLYLENLLDKQSKEYNINL
jgi:lysophospholipase L1-like esterase